MLVLLPEAWAAARAARADRLQSSMNLAIGSALACIGLTIPVVVLAAVTYDLPLVLGLGGEGPGAARGHVPGQRIHAGDGSHAHDAGGRASGDVRRVRVSCVRALIARYLPLRASRCRGGVSRQAVRRKAIMLSLSE